MKDRMNTASTTPHLATSIAVCRLLRCAGKLPCPTQTESWGRGRGGVKFCRHAGQEAVSLNRKQLVSATTAREPRHVANTRQTMQMTLEWRFKPTHLYLFRNIR